MKKYFYSLLAMATMMLGIVSCSSEDKLIPSGSDEGVAVNFKLSLEGVVPSRAADHNANGDLYATGKTVDNVIAAVYSNGVEIEELRQDENSINEDLTCNVTFRLIEGQTYDFVFWAEKTGTGYYDITDLTAIKVNYTLKDENGTVKSCDANDESRDAFTAVRKGLVVKAGGMTETIELTRPFAQLNIASLAEDHRIAELTGFGCDELSSTIVVNKLYDTYDALNEKPSGQAWNVRFGMTDVPAAAGEVLKNVKSKDGAEENYVGYLSMNYFLADKENGQTIEVKATFDSDNSDVPVSITIPNVPVQRNWRTNIIGNILTEQTVFNIVIDPNFVDDHNYPETDKQALEYAAANGGEVTLTESVVLDQTLNVTQNMVINLNGNSIFNKADNTKTDVIVVKEGATLTINGDGKVEAVSGNDGYAIIAEGKVIINGGTYRSGLDEKQDGNCTVYARGKGEVYIYGGDFATPEGDDKTFVINKKDADRSTTTIKIYGGTFKNFNPEDNAAEGVGTNFCAEGYKSTLVGDSYVVVEQGTTYVSTSEELVTAFGKGGKVVLANNIALEEIIIMLDGNEVYLDMNGKTITVGKDGVDPLIEMKTGSSLVIDGNGTFDLENNYSYSMIIPRGDVTIKNGNFLRGTGGDVKNYGSYFVGINGGKGKLIIEGGYFDGGYYKEGDCFNNCRTLLNCSWSQYIRVYGGTFVAQNPAWGDEGMSSLCPHCTPTYCQGIFLEGQTKDSTEMPEGYTITEGTTADGRPTYTVSYSK